MKYIVGFCIMAFCVNLALNRAVELGDAQGYARGYNDGKRAEPNTAQCIGFWFGGKVPANRMNELKNFCKEMK
jgi:hypothetical protein